MNELTIKLGIIVVSSCQLIQYPYQDIIFIFVFVTFEQLPLPYCVAQKYKYGKLWDCCSKSLISWMLFYFEQHIRAPNRLLDIDIDI